MKFCLHKYMAWWCEICREFHDDPLVEITTYADLRRIFMCYVCGGIRYEEREEIE